jgi:broad specificity phosphatase PhoE
VLAIIRHGATLANEQGLVQGKTDLSLSRLGVAQAERIADWAQGQAYSRILASTSKRAAETAQIVGSHLGLPHTLHPELCERDYDGYEGISAEELRLMRRAEGHSFADPTQDWWGVAKVESDDAVFERTWNLIQSSYPRAHCDSVMVVTHAGVIKSFLHKALSITRDRSNCFKVPNGALIALEYDGGGYLQLRGFYPFLP